MADIDQAEWKRIIGLLAGGRSLKGLVQGRTFLVNACFANREFPGDVDFSECRFMAGADFRDMTIHGRALFAGARFAPGHSVMFDGTTFGSWAFFERTVFEGNASFVGARFETARNLGDLVVEGELNLDMATFLAAVKMRFHAERASFARADFREGVRMYVSRGDIAVDGASFGRASLMQDVTWADRPESNLGAGPARLVSLRQADVSGLVISGLDVRACLFAGAHGLDGLRFEATEFARAPQSRIGTGREAIAEEHAWRAAHDEQRWKAEDARPAAWLGRSDDAGEESGRVPEAKAQSERVIAEIYRSLRKGREDAKDSPGAGDFYFGEMEMRRLDARGIERALLGGYRWLSGYALRPGRTLAWLGLVVALATWGFAGFGFRGDRSPYAVTVAPTFRVEERLIRPLRPPADRAGFVETIPLRPRDGDCDRRAQRSGANRRRPLDSVLAADHGSAPRHACPARRSRARQALI